MSVRELVLEFVESINQRDVAALGRLMAKDHEFVDSDGTVQSGRRVMKGAWAAYFGMVPDYRIEVGEVFEADDRVMIAGRASGTFAPDGKVLAANHWQIPAAWRARVAGGHVAEWQVYADTEQLRRLMGQERRPGHSS